MCLFACVCIRVRAAIDCLRVCVAIDERPTRVRGGMCLFAYVYACARLYLIRYSIPWLYSIRYPLFLAYVYTCARLYLIRYPLFLAHVYAWARHARMRYIDLVPMREVAP